jgi:type IV pilus assembly protein PilW
VDGDAVTLFSNRIGIQNMKYSRNRLLFSGKFQGGLTLIEILVSLAISVLVIAGVLEVYTSSKQTYRVQEASSRLQENGRFAISFIARDLRMAGHVGCLSQLSDDNQRLSSSLNSQPLYDLHLPVAGYHYDGTG